MLEQKISWVFDEEEKRGEQKAATEPSAPIEELDRITNEILNYWQQGWQQAQTWEETPAVDNTQVATTGAEEETQEASVADKEIKDQIDKVEDVKEKIEYNLDDLEKILNELTTNKQIWNDQNVKNLVKKILEQENYINELTQRYEIIKDRLQKLIWENETKTMENIVWADILDIINNNEKLRELIYIMREKNVNPEEASAKYEKFLLDELKNMWFDVEQIVWYKKELDKKWWVVKNNNMDWNKEAIKNDEAEATTKRVVNRTNEEFFNSINI